MTSDVDVILEKKNSFLKHPSGRPPYKYVTIFQLFFSNFVHLLAIKLATLIALINVTSCLPILENSTLHKTKIHPAHLLISLQNFQYSYRTFNIITETNDDFSHGHFEP